jgi:hypothetical protein
MSIATRPTFAQLIADLDSWLAKLNNDTDRWNTQVVVELTLRTASPAELTSNFGSVCRIVALLGKAAHLRLQSYGGVRVALFNQAIVASKNPHRQFSLAA